MKTLLLTIFIFASTFSSAQVYAPFPTDSVKWTDGSRSTGPNPPCTISPCCRETEYVIEKDTLIAGRIYHKLLNYTTQDPSCGSPTVSPIRFPVFVNGFFRNDTASKKVWFKEFPTSVDTLLYDFDLSLGQIYPETFIAVPGKTSRVDSIKMDTFFGEVRRIYYINDTLIGVPSETIELIEGIGASTGFLNSMEPVGLGYNYYFIGQCWRGLDESLQSCDLTVGIAEQHAAKDKDWNYHYNATTQSIVISEGTKVTQLKIYDLSGKQVGDYRLESAQVNVNLKQGIYLLQAIDTEGNFYGGKLAIN